MPRRVYPPTSGSLPLSNVFIGCLLPLAILLAGCGESTQERMMKRMQAKAKLRAAEEAAAEEAAAQKVQSPVPSPQPSPQSPAKNPAAKTPPPRETPPTRPPDHAEPPAMAADRESAPNAPTSAQTEAADRADSQQGETGEDRESLAAKFPRSAPAVGTAPSDQAIDSASGNIVTGDTTGELRVWRGEVVPPRRYRLGGSALLACLPYGPEGLWLAATEDGQAISWKATEPHPAARAFARFDSTPTRLSLGRSGAGLVVGDQSGTVTVWTPADGRLKKSSVRAQASAVVGSEWLGDKKTLLTAGAEGQLTRWTLPLPSARTVPLAQPRPRFLVASPQGKLVAIAGKENQVDLYDIESAAPSHRLMLPPVVPPPRPCLRQTVNASRWATTKGISTFLSSHPRLRSNCKPAKSCEPLPAPFASWRPQQARQDERDSVCPA